MALVGTVGNVSPHVEYVLLVDFLYSLLLGSVIYVPSGIVVAASVLNFRPKWGGWKVSLTTAGGLLLLALVFSAVVIALIGV
jgi:hypothetical protein